MPASFCPVGSIMILEGTIRPSLIGSFCSIAVKAD
jgi:hypothetical protein